MIFRRRSLSVVALIAISGLVASCSSGSESAQLRFVPGGGMANEAAGDAKMAWGNVTYEIEGTLPDMPSEMMAYEIRKQSAPTAEFERIATVLGVEGEVAKDPAASGEFEEIFEAYSIGDSDMSDDVLEQAMWMYGDGRFWSWSYYPGDGGVVSDSTTSSDGGSSGSGSDSSEPSEPSDLGEPCAPDDKECIERTTEIPEPPSPPENIPSKSEVETLTQDLLKDLGVELGDVQISAYSDDWTAWSQAQLLLDGIALPISWYFSFGENAELTSASGMILDLKQGATYELADATSAVSRLGDYRYYGGYGAGMARDASIGWAEAPTDEVITQPTDDTLVVSDEVPTTDVPVTPEDITITVTSVKMAYAWMFEENGKQVLMPAFAYSSDDGEVGTVIALSDDLFDFEEVTDTSDEDNQPEPAPIVDDPIPAEEANTLIGLTEDEAMVAAEAEGWEFRVAARDGEQYMLTTDYVMNRVNVTIVEGVVTEVTVG